MSQILQIKLNPDYAEMQSYAAKGANLMSLLAKLPDGKIVLDKQYTVCVGISVDGMLGLGTELIKNAMEIKATGYGLDEEAESIYSGLASQVLGIFLTYDSCKLVLGNAENLGTYLEQVRLSRKASQSESEKQLWQIKPGKRNFFSEQTQAMDQIFEINLNSDINEVQIYEEEGANLMHLSVKLPNGEIITGDSRCAVCIGLSVDGMLGLGTELIRKAMRMKACGKKESQDVEVLEPIGPAGGSSGSLGVYLTHDSCSLELRVKDLGTIEEQLKLAEIAAGVKRT